MQAREDAASELSSSPISSPAGSPPTAGLSDTIRVAARPQSSTPSLLRGGVAVAPSAAPAPSAHAHPDLHPRPLPSTSDSTAAVAPAPAPAPAKQKRQRKKKDVDADGKPIDDGKPKEKKPRKVRDPKDKSSAAPPPRKKTAVKVETDMPPAPSPSTASKPNAANYPIFDNALNDSKHRLPSHASDNPPGRFAPHTDSPKSRPPPPPSQLFNPPRPVSSGQNYDPVRAATLESAPPRPSHQPPNSALSNHSSPHVNRASASPSIASLIDPPMLSATSAPSAVRSPQASLRQPAFVNSSPHRANPALAPPPPPHQPSPSLTAARLTAPTPDLDSAMDIDQPSSASKPNDRPAEMKPSSKSSSAAPTPKPPPARSSPPAPKGTGSGLLSSSDLFGGPSTNGTAERRGVNIDIHIPLRPDGGNHINIAQEIIKKYGRDAVNPRAAAHRERLLQVMAAANKIDRASADDMSVDLMSDPDADSNVDATGPDEDRSAAHDTDKPRKRRKKAEEYDFDDEFIDDTELAWQQQAAVAQDGFFVYSGPLIPEGEAARADASTVSSRGGRGRGRGRGKGAAAASGSTHASLAEKKEPVAASANATASTTTGRGRGRGRGSGAPRKPRITKADRERMEAEKSDRERAAAHIGNTPPAASPASVAVTPSVNGTHADFPNQKQSTGTTA